MRVSAFFLNHGGGPMPILGDHGHKELVAFLTGKAKDWLGKPKAIVLVSAHWQTKKVAISAVKDYSLLYDYYGFPKEAYDLKYRAKGDVEVAKLIRTTLQEYDIVSELDFKRGLDHGGFIPLMLMAPDESIPIVQVSVLETENVTELLRYGEALSSIRDQNIAIIGSGMSFHNLLSGTLKKENKEFESHLLDTLKLDRKNMIKKIQKWDVIPSARLAHPLGASEHFSPYLVVVGAGGEDPIKEIIRTDVMGYSVHSFLY